MFVCWFTDWILPTDGGARTDGCDTDDTGDTMTVNNGRLVSGGLAETYTQHAPGHQECKTKRIRNVSVQRNAKVFGIFLVAKVKR